MNSFVNPTFRNDDARVFESVVDGKSLTVPCRAMSVREIIDRYRATGELPAGTPVYGDAEPQGLDLIDRYRAAEAEARAKAEALELQREQAKAKAQADADAKFNAAVEEEVKKRMQSTQP